VSTTEELHERKSRGSDLESREYGRGGSAVLTTRHVYPQKLALISPTSGGHSVGIVLSQTEATEILCDEDLRLKQHMPVPSEILRMQSPRGYHRVMMVPFNPANK
jgi:hypothetical protein